MKNRIFAVLAALFCTFTLYGQTSNDALRLSDPGFLSGARALGMGNSLAHAGGDFSSVSLNPAGLGLFNNSEISVSGYNNNYSNNTTFYGNSLSEAYDATNFSQFGLVYKLPTSRGSMVLAFGYNRTRDFNRIVKFSGYNYENNSMTQELMEIWNSKMERWTQAHGEKPLNIPYTLGLTYAINEKKDGTNINGKLTQSGRTIDEGGLNNWSFAGAMEVQKDLYVGATINVISGKFERRKQFTEADKNNVYSTIKLDPGDSKTFGFKYFNYDENIAWDLSGWDAQDRKSVV